MRRECVLGVALGLWAGSAVWGQPAEADLVQLMTVPTDTSGPVVDGGIGAKEWARAVGPFGFQLLGGKGCAPVQPEVLVLRDTEALYLAARLPLPERATPKAEATERDGQVWTDDAFEVFVDRGRTRTEYLQFIVNSASVCWDSKGQDGGWDGEWEAKAKVGEGVWTVEMRLPFTTLGGAPAEGDEWGLNFAWDRQTPEPMVASWAATEGTLHDAGAFGVARFVTEAPPARLSRFGLADRPGRIEAAGEWQAGGPYRVEAQGYQLRDGVFKRFEKGAAAGTARGELLVSINIPDDGKFLKAGEYLAIVTVATGDQVLSRASIPYVEVDLDPSGCGRPLGELSAEIRLWRGGEEVRQRVERFEKAPETVRLPVNDLPAGPAGVELD